MTDPREPQYPYYYPANPLHPHLPPPHPQPGAGLSARLGERAVRRPEPRLGVSLAGTGIALALLGVLIWGGDYLTGPHRGGGGGGSSRHLLGAALSLLVVVAGYALAVRRRRGPLVTAGVTASALGVPLLLGFLTFDSSHGGQSGPPFSLDVIVLVSVLVWMLSYILVPGTRGHSFYLGLAAVTLWVYVVDKAEPATVSLTGLLQNAFLPGFGRAPVTPDWSTVATLSLVFGLGYYLVAFVLDHSGRTGPGAALAVGGFLATAAGIAAASANLHQIGTGIVLILVGLVVTAFGARGGRRFTTWVWSAGTGLGIALIISKLASDNTAAAGVALIAAGAVVVLVGQVLAQALHEPDDLVPTVDVGPRREQIRIP